MKYRDSLQNWNLYKHIYKISKFLYKSGFSKKEAQTVALQYSEELRQKFVQELTVYNRYVCIREWNWKW